VFGGFVAEEREVILFEGGRGQGCFRVEEAGELSNYGVSLVEEEEKAFSVS
jgi:hypothetical protein